MLLFIAALIGLLVANRQYPVPVKPSAGGETQTYAGMPEQVEYG